MKKLFITIPLLFLLLNLNAQDAPGKIKISGIVTDSVENKGIPYATVLFFNLTTNKAETALAADINGKFEAYVTASNPYKISVSAMGFQKFDTNLSASETGNDINMAIIKLNTAISEVGTVEIIATKPLVVTDADKITYNTESDPDAQTLTALEMLRKVPLVTVDGEDNIQVKGSNSFKVFLNGKPSPIITNNPKEFLKNLPASSVKSIEVITSPGAKYDAEGIGGILNIITYKHSIKGYSGSVGLGVNSLLRYNSSASFTASFGKLVFSFDFGGGLVTNEKSRSVSERYNYISNEYYLSNSLSQNKNSNQNTYGTSALSYDFDSLNLITASFSLWGVQYSDISEGNSQVWNTNNQLSQSFLSLGNSKGLYFSPNLSVDYQNIAKSNPEKILTLSYQLSSNPNNSEDNYEIKNIYNYFSYRKNEAETNKSNEHTLQLDYVLPFKNNLTVESGAKYIMRISSNITDVKNYNYNTDIFEPDFLQSIDFAYNQNIAALYSTLGGKVKSFGYKAGLRVEHSETIGNFNSDNGINFKNSSMEYVPSASFSYQLPKSSIQFTYSKRIQRPWIWYLNPYINKSNPKNVYFGNPELLPEHFHTFNLNYNKMLSFGNVNLNMFYSFSNNGIDRIMWITSEDIIYQTYKNTLIQNQTGASVSSNIRVGTKLNINLNMSGSYNSLKNKDSLNLTNSGFNYNGYSNISYTGNKDIRFSVNGGVYSPRISLYTQNSTFYYYGFSISRDFINKKLNISVSARDFLQKERVWDWNSFSDSFKQNSSYYRPGRHFAINARFRFGSMETAIKRVNKTIENTDLEQGGNESN